MGFILNSIGFTERERKRAKSFILDFTHLSLSWVCAESSEEPGVVKHLQEFWKTQPPLTIVMTGLNCSLISGSEIRNLEILFFSLNPSGGPPTKWPRPSKNDPGEQEWFLTYPGGLANMLSYYLTCVGTPSHSGWEYKRPFWLAWFYISDTGTSLFNVLQKFYLTGQAHNSPPSEYINLSKFR